MKHILSKTYNQIPLTYQESYDTMINMGIGKVSEIEMTAFISAFNMKEINIDELKGFRNALLDLCLKVKIDADQAIDMCGTGGDGKNTFNVSTISSFVVAGAGYRVVKHGNYGVSSLCGSSNVLEELGYNFTTDSSELSAKLDKANICFLRAPLFHPAMKHVAPIRKALGLKTFFNLLGPLVNPAQPSHQLVGVFNLKVARKYKYLLEEDEKQFKVLHNTDGYDEATLTAPLKVMSNNSDLELFPPDLLSQQIKPEQLYGGTTIKEAAELFTTILAGNGTEAQTNVIAANAGLAIQCFESELSLADCIEKAREAIASQKAMETLKKVLE
ncbi:MAG: anthranilate phosphoribosyltransferase [Flavobacteriales bacterium]|nr:anthranilate phosphoribosyltransferase [Flavobacteriales bacterium]